MTIVTVSSRKTVRVEVQLAVFDPVVPSEEPSGRIQKALPQRSGLPDA